MQGRKISFGSGATTFYFDAAFHHLKKMTPQKTTVLFVDAHVYAAHEKLLRGWKIIKVDSGEENKTQSTVDAAILQLINLQADRTWTIVGVGGGVVTDLAGYVAAVFLRGINFGFVPTTLLAMVDAAIGGKNGVDVGLHKNMVGTIRQPSFLLYDVALLKTLPANEWRNGFAEIIKHAAIMDAAMFRDLEKTDLAFYMKNKAAVKQLIRRNALLKIKVVRADEKEMSLRKQLNFGHTLGHAVETQHALMHGEAVAIGMAFAAKVSAAINGFKHSDRLINLLKQYGLPVECGYEKQRTFDLLIADKKREGTSISFVLLNKIGKANLHRISLHQLFNYL